MNVIGLDDDDIPWSKFDLKVIRKQILKAVEEGEYQDVDLAARGIAYYANTFHPEATEEHAKVIEEIGLHMIEHDGPVGFLPGDAKKENGGYMDRYYHAENVFSLAKSMNSTLHGKRSAEVMLDTFYMAICQFWYSSTVAIDTAERVIRHEKRIHGDDSRIYAEHLVVLGEMKVGARWQTDTGIEQLEEAKGLLEGMGDEGKPFLARALRSLSLGDESSYEALIETMMKEDTDKGSLTSKEASVEELAESDDQEAAEKACFEYLSLLDEMGKGDSLEAVSGWLQLATIRMKRGDMSGSEEAANWAHHLGKGLDGDLVSNEGEALRFMVDLALYRGHFQRATELQQQSIDMVTATNGPKSSEAGEEWMKLCDLHLEWQHLDEAQHAWKMAVKCKRPEGEGDCIDILRSSKEAQLQRARGELHIVHYPMKTAKLVLDGKSTCNNPDKYKPYYEQELLEAACAKEEEQVVISTWGHGIEYNRVLRRTVLDSDRLDFTPFFEEVAMRLSIATAERNGFWDHLETIIARTDLAALLIKKEQLDPAEKILIKNTQVLRATFGESHPELARVFRAQVHMLIARQQASAAEGLVRKAFAMDYQIHGDGHLNLAEDLSLLALVQGMKRDYGNAISSIDSAIQLHGRKPRHETPAGARLYMVKANLMSQMQNQKGVAEALERARYFYAMSLGRKHPRTLALKEQVKLAKG